MGIWQRVEFYPVSYAGVRQQFAIFLTAEL